MKRVFVVGVSNLVMPSVYNLHLSTDDRPAAEVPGSRAQTSLGVWSLDQGQVTVPLVMSLVADLC